MESNITIVFSKEGQIHSFWEEKVLHASQFFILIDSWDSLKEETFLWHVVFEGKFLKRCFLYYFKS